MFSYWFLGNIQKWVYPVGSVTAGVDATGNSKDIPSCFGAVNFRNS